jgi:thiol-disulfide isomerase/thioredoxin
MIAILRAVKLPLLVFAVAATGCACRESTSPGEAGSTETAATTAPPAVATTTPPAAATEAPQAEAAPAAAAKPEGAAEEPVKLELVKFDQFQARMANPKVKYTVVDVWATWCGPCKENFPHLVEMNAKYGGKEIAFASLSFDDPAEAKQVHDAQEFLEAKKAVFANYLLDEEQGVGNEKLDINAIPAVFIFGSDGKVVKKFTLDDPNKQFTYDDVEKAVVALLEGKPLPADEPAKPEAK